MTDNVEHPPHYTQHPSGVECIEITEHMGFNLGNTVKYVWRADLKNDDIEDLKKARWYLDREIQRREKRRDKAEAKKTEMPVYEPRPDPTRNAYPGDAVINPPRLVVIPEGTPDSVVVAINASLDAYRKPPAWSFQSFREGMAPQNSAEADGPTRKIPNQFYVRDANGNIITVASLPTDTTITLFTHDTGNDLTPYQAYALSDALKAHATARRNELFGQAEWEIDE